MKLSHFFLPHPETHKKAHLISPKAIIVYILIFFGLQMGLHFVSQVKPGVLGVTSDINQKELIELTNTERQKKGLSLLKEDPRLDQAALEKGQNMFAENYWAHYSPSGKDPWGFINGAGYKFYYAGENLARNFYRSQDVVEAWMNSPSHRDNLLNSHYQDIGIAVLRGVLNGEETTLIVQEFGSPAGSTASLPINPQTLSVNQNVLPVDVGKTENGSKLSVLSSINALPNSNLFDPLMVIKVFGMSVLGFLAMLILIDILIIKRREVVRLSSRNLSHLALIGVAAASLLNLSSGQIL